MLRGLLSKKLPISQRKATPFVRTTTIFPRLNFFGIHYRSYGIFSNYSVDITPAVKQDPVILEHPKSGLSYVVNPALVSNEDITALIQQHKADASPDSESDEKIHEAAEDFKTKRDALVQLETKMHSKLHTHQQQLFQAWTKLKTMLQLPTTGVVAAHNTGIPDDDDLTACGRYRNGCR